MTSPYRLPRTVIPRRYALTLEPDLESATFRGSEQVAVDVLTEVTEVVVNAAELEITEAYLVSADGTRVGAEVACDDETERATLTLDHPVQPGRWTMHASFHGLLNDRLRGFYRSTFEDATGQKRGIATTQFEATDARRAFPCWDEPDLKAVFSVTAVIPAELTAISNTAEAERRPASNGRVAVRFHDTVTISTYLVALVVGPLEVTAPVDVGGTPLRVVHAPGKGDLTAFALEAGAFFLRWFQDYYGIPYPGDKVDFVALPDFAFGAMENLGAITFREATLLVDPRRASQQELSHSADVIAHELAHMWFGDLVTMKWWNGVWLNEAFATFMEMKASEAYRPDWKRWLAFAAEPGAEKSDSMQIDALHSARPVEFPVGSPAEAHEMFDPLTYGKGSAVLRMLEQFMGEDAFRRGIQEYLRRHSFANTETVDLWEALASATDYPVEEIMNSFILQPGYPRLEVELAKDGRGFHVRQQRFLYVGESKSLRWRVPMLLRTNGRAQRVLVDGESSVASAEPIEALVANAGGHGFYRVRYSPPLRQRLVDRLQDLGALERYTLLDDAWAFTLAGEDTAADFLILADRYREDTEHAVWQLLVRALDELHRILDADQRPAMEARVRQLVAPAAGRLGWEASDEEDDLTRRLRGLLLGALGRLGKEQDVQERARTLIDSVLHRPESVDPDVAMAVLFTIADAGTPPDYERFVDRYQHATTPQEERRFLAALADFPDGEMAEHTFQMTLDGRIRTQDGPFTVSRLLANKTAGIRTWELVKAHWDRIIAAFPVFTLRYLFYHLPALSRPELAADVEAFFVGREVPYAAKALEQRLELLRVSVALREREASRLPAHLS